MEIIGHQEHWDLTATTKLQGSLIQLPTSSAMG